jgi:hypothetical protein
LPSVAWYEELSMKASYNQAPKNSKIRVTPPPKRASPLWGRPVIIPPANPSAPKIKPTGATTTRKMMASIMAATTRIQNPA